MSGIIDVLKIKTIKYLPDEEDFTLYVDKCYINLGVDLDKELYKNIDLLKSGKKYDGKIFEKNYGKNWKSLLEIKSDSENVKELMKYKKGGALLDFNDVNPFDIEAPVSVSDNSDKTYSTSSSGSSSSSGTGSDFDIDLEGKDKLLIKSKKVVDKLERQKVGKEFVGKTKLIDSNYKVIYITDVMIPNNMWSNRKKFYNITGIPVYKQHIFRKNFQSMTVFEESNIIIERNLSNINEYNENIENIPVNEELYKYSNVKNITTKSEEFTEKIKLYDELYILNIDEMFKHSDKKQILKNNYYCDIIYYTFVQFIFPVISSREFFIDYLKGVNIRQKYGSYVDPTSDFIENEISEELKIETIFSSNMESINTLVDVSKFILRRLEVEFDKSIIKDIQSIMNSIDTSSETPIIVVNNKNDIVKKYNKTVKNTKIFRNCNRDSISVYRKVDDNERNKFEINFDVVKTTIKYNTVNETKSLLNDHISIVNRNMDFINKILESNLIFDSYSNISSMDVEYDINIITSSSNFISTMEKMKDLEKSGFVKLFNVNEQKTVYEYSLLRGMYKYNINNIFFKKNMGNIFKMLTNEEYLSLYISDIQNSKKVHIIHKFNSIRIKILNITRRETTASLAVIKYIAYIFSNHKVDIKSVDNKNRKLKELDPELYTFGDSGVYSRTCQKPAQPNIYDINEYNTLPKNKQKNLFEYWNYTTNEPVYYECPNKKFSYLGFITGKHKDGKCIPCCFQREIPEFNPNATEFLKRSIINHVCIKNKYWTDEDDNLLNKKSADYIINFEKEISEDRIANLPNKFPNGIFNKNIMVYGINQNNISVISILSKVLNIKYDDVMKKILEYIKKNENTLFLNDIHSHLKTFQNLIKVIESDSFKRYSQVNWNLYFLNFYHLFNVNPITITNVGLTGDCYVNFPSNVKNYESIINKTNNIIIISKDDESFYLLFKLINKKTGEMKYMFNEDDSDIHNFKEFIGNQKQSLNVILDFNELEKYRKEGISLVYLNKYNEVYACIVDGVYIPVLETSFNSYNEYKVSYIPPSEIKNNSEDTVKWVDKFNKRSESENNIVRIDLTHNIRYKGKIIALYSEFQKYYFYVNRNSKPIKDLPVVDILFDPIEVNKTIHNNSLPDNKKELKFYDNAKNKFYMFDGFVIKFLEELKNKRRTEKNIRKKIINAINSNGDIKFLKDNHFNKDYDIIVKDIIDLNDKKNSIKKLDETVFEFDYYFETKEELKKFIDSSKIKSNKSIIDEIYRFLHDPIMRRKIFYYESFYTGNLRKDIIKINPDEFIIF